MTPKWNCTVTKPNIASGRADVDLSRKDPGDWVDNTDYVIDDLVCYNGIVYKSKTEHTSSRGSGVGLGGEPDTNPSDWELVSGEKQKSFSVSFSQAVIKTTEDRVKIFDAAWAKLQKELTKQAEEAAFIDNFDEQAVTNLEARETQEVIIK